MTTPSERATDDRSLRESVPPLEEWARTYVVGVFMGTADGVPGVSGGTIALIAGIYERLIAAITNVTPDRAVRLLRALWPLGDGVDGDQAVAVIEEVDVWFLLSLVAGVATAIVIVTRIVHVGQDEFPVALFGFFFGLIAASALILLREVSIRTAGEILAALAGFTIAFVLSGADELLGGGGGLLIVFFAGAIAVSAMILPGISGSLILIILQQYTRMSGALSEFVDGLAGLVTGGAVDAVTDPGVEVVTFIVGGLVGLFTISRLIRRALDANREVTYAFLIALVVGALRAPVAELNNRPDVVWSNQTIGTFVAVASVGALIVLVLDWYAVDIDLESV